MKRPKCSAFVSKHSAPIAKRGKSGSCWSASKDMLVSMSLVHPEGRVHDSIRNIVLSAVEGDGVDMTLRSPLAATERVAANA